MEVATRLKDAGKPDDALTAFQAIVKDHPEHGEAWYEIGHLYHLRGDLERALPAHLNAARFGKGRSKTSGLYNAACVHAMQGKADEALDLLEAAAEAGLRNANWALQDSDLAAVRDAPRFQQILARIWVNEAGGVAARGDRDGALERLEKAAALGYDAFASLADDPQFEPIRDTARFQALLSATKTGGTR
jgi:tetratricopeptide (TPR) repeat protein